MTYSSPACHYLPGYQSHMSAVLKKYELLNHTYPTQTPLSSLRGKLIYDQNGGWSRIFGDYDKKQKLLLTL